MDSLKLTYDVPVPPAAAFYLFVGEIGQWWPGVFTHDPGHFRGMSVEAFVGGAVTTHLDDEDIVWGEVVEVSAPHRIVWRQWWRQSSEYPSRIGLRFSAIETGARLEFEHGGWTPDNVHHRQRFLEWPIILAHFVAHARAHARGTGLAPRLGRGVT